MTVLADICETKYISRLENDIMSLHETTIDHMQNAGDKEGQSVHQIHYSCFMLPENVVKGKQYFIKSFSAFLTHQ